MDFKNSDIANGSEVTNLIGADASASLEGAALLKMAIQSGNIMPLTADGQLVLPVGVGLDDITVVGRDLIIQMPDGTQMIVPDGAIFVPQIVVDGVAVPALNFAALLVGQEPQPAAGLPQSSGGNFADTVGDIGDPFALGDLLLPTQLAFPQPEEREVVPALVDRDPDVIIQDGGPAGRDVIDNVNETGLPGTRANGNVESPGSVAGNGSDSTTGTIFVTSPDGIASITINGVVVTGAAGQQITTPLGVLTLSALNGDQIGYTYRLSDNSSGDTTTDAFLVSLTDPDGDVATARLTINIADDVPTARNDIDSLAGGTFGPELGNVITGAGTTSGSAGADTLGADGASISGVRAGASGSFAAVGTTINGQYGTLTLGANGNYSYVRNVNTPGGVTDVFAYQLTDGDGDASTATLTINIGDAPNRITSVPRIGDGTTVLESHLPSRNSEPSGSQFDGNPETTSGTITFNSPDGVGNVTISGVVLSPGALPQQVSSDATIALVITGYSYNPVTGVGSITYVYTLNDNTLNTNGESLSFPIVVTDLDGDVASDSLIIKVVDDAPLAANDSGTQQIENAAVAVNVFVNDTPGADGVNLATGVSVVAGSLTGAGALAYNNNGSFTYLPAAGEQGIVTFQYRITDGDGDTSTATVTITLLNDSVPSVEVRGEDVVAEAGLPAGSDAVANSETTSGTIAIATGGDTLASLVINGVNVTDGGPVVGVSGTLTVTLSGGAYSYSYTLTGNTAGDNTTDSFNVVVTDSDGDSASDTLVIAVQDDVPTARADIDTIAAGTYGPATGNVITDAELDGGKDTAGADGATVSAITGAAAGTVGGTTAGTYGVLTLNADGSYSYARNPGTAGGVSDVFTYTLRDGDGDTSTATLTISIADSPTTLDLPIGDEAGTRVDEAGLPAGSDAASTRETTNGTIAYNAPDGPATVTIDGVAANLVGQTFVGSFGTLTVTSIANGAVGYSYTLTTNTTGDATFDDFAVVITDQDGDQSPGTLVIDISDDVPTARADIDSVTEDSAVVADGNVITGANVADANNTDGVADTQGADSAAVTAIAFGATNGTVGSALAGTYGALTMNANGGYSYALNNANAAVQGLDGDDSLTEVFTYTITDGDGDTSTTTLTVTINGSDDPITINGLNADGPDFTVDEDDLSDGSSPNAAALTQSGSFTVNGVDGIASIKIGGTETSVGQSFANAYGTFTITSISGPVNGTATAITVGYSYVLTDNTAHANANGQNFLTELFDVAVTDTDGSTDTDQIEVRIVDDVPTAVNDTDTVAGGSNAPATGNVITDAELDGGKDTVGSDGAVVSAVTGVAAGTVGGTTAGTYGVLTLNADGSYSYTRNDGTPGNVQDVFTYEIKDADGDTSTATLTITIQDDRPFVGPNATVLLDDDALIGGNLGGIGDDVDAANVTGTLSGSGGDGALTFAFAATGAPTGFSYEAGLGGSVLVKQGATTVLTVTLDSATGAYTVVQNAPIIHAAGGNENNAPFTLSYTVTDVDGDQDSGTLAINVDDDTPIVSSTGAVPTLTVDETVLATNASTSFAGIFTTSYGADGAGTTAYTLGVVAGPSGLVDTATGQAVNLSLNGSGVVEGRTAGSDALVFTVAVNGSGSVTLDQVRAVVHNDPLDADEFGASAAMLSSANLITLTATSTDGDGDTASASLDIGGALAFEDDGPTITNAETPLLVANSGTVSSTGLFAFSTGTDGAAVENDAIKSVTFSATVAGNAVTSSSITAVSEDASTAVFNISFSYATGPSSSVTNTGVLTFDKDAETYTVDLAKPIDAFSISQTSTGTLFEGYQPDSTTTDNTQPEVSVTQINTNLFIQFTGVDGASATVNDPLVAPSSGTNQAFVNGEMFTATKSWVSVSNSSNGVAGDTIGGDEILNFNLYNTNPTGTVGTPTASADAMFLKFDGIGKAEDFIVILKLFNETLNIYTTKAVLVQNGDIFKGPGAGPGGYSSITLDNNDGLVIIESNDYNAVGENWTIVGAQIVVDPLTVTGQAINLNGTIGGTGGSTTAPLQSFADDTNTGAPMKITSIGLVTRSSTEQAAQLTFNVTVQDGDGDTASQTLVVNVGGTPPVVLDLDGDGVEFVSAAAGVTFDYHGDGSPESTAWVSADDGLLVLDRNGDGIVNDGSEIVFARDGLTDLQGLAADFDGNHDGVLDASDADFANFGVWQDANSNGVTDAGEYRSLSDAGIVSIKLVSDGIAYSAANGSVSVAGQSVYTKADGSTGIVADAAFATNGTTSVVSRSADQIRTNSATTSIIAAALLGLAVEENAAAVPHENLDPSGALISENPGIGNEIASLASTGGASFVSDLAFEPTHDFAQRMNDVASNQRLSEEADVARSFQDAPMAERSALLEDSADPVSDDQSNFANAFGGGDHVMHSMLDITAFSGSAGASENAGLPLPIENALREAMPDLMVDRLIDAFTAALGAPANDAGSGANDSELLAGILSQGVDAFQLAAMASNDLSGAHQYDMAMISHG